MADSIKASKAGLEIVDQKRRVKGWTKKATAWCDAAGSISSSTLDRFWQLKPIKQENFVAICQALGIEDWESIADFALLFDTPKLPPTPNLYNPNKWVGRESLINELLSKLNQNTRILWLTGISGVGKTTLGECLVVKSWTETNPFDWVSVEIFDRQLPNFTTGVEAILNKLGDTNIDPQERNDCKIMGDRLLNKLQSHPYWIQIDSVERLLNIENNAFIDDYWLTFLNQCLNSNFPSRLLLTSQALPIEMMELGDRYPNVFYTVTLSGLSATEEHKEQLEFFSKAGITVNESNSCILGQIGDIYEGHPLALQVIAGEIHQDYNNNVAEYWEVNRQEFEQITRELPLQRLSPALYNEALQKRIRQRIEKSLQQLSNNALSLLCRSSVYRRSVPRIFWLGMLWDNSEKEKQQAYLQLGDRALVEKEKGLIRQHNLIRDIAYDLLREDGEIWKAAEQKAAEIWLNEYKPQDDAENIEKVRGYLEAFYHYCEIKDYKKSRRILIEEGFGPLLEIWSYYIEFKNLHYQLYGKLDLSTDMIALKGIGNAYAGLGDFQKALEWYEKSLDIASKTNNNLEKGEILNNIAACYKNLRNYDYALGLYFMSLKISIRENDKRLRARVLGNIANIYHETNNYTLAIEYHQKALEITEELLEKDPSVLHVYSINVGNLGDIYHNIGDYEKAMEYQLAHLNISRKIGDQKGEGRALMRLGRTYHSLGQYSDAIKHLEDSLTISEKIGDSKAQITALGELADVYISMEEYLKAIEYAEYRLNILNTINDPNVYLYYKPYLPYFICVVARHLNGEGFIITAYRTNRIKIGENVWTA
ncbi:MAG: tetratricopeptide repeat protein [Crocosphaera sp.]